MNDAKNNNPPTNGVQPISLDPDDAVHLISLEEILSQYKVDPQKTYKTYQFKHCLPVLHRLTAGLAGRLHIPIVQIASAAADLGYGQLLAIFEQRIDQIAGLIAQCCLQTGNWRLHEQATKVWRVDFKVSLVNPWAIRINEAVMDKVDAFAARSGFAVRDIRQLVILAGLGFSHLITRKDQDRIHNFVLEFATDLKEKQKFLSELLTQQPVSIGLDRLMENYLCDIS